MNWFYFIKKEWFVKQIIYLFEFIILKIAYQDFLKPIRKPVIHTLTRISLTDIVILERLMNINIEWIFCIDLNYLYNAWNLDINFSIR